MPDIAMCRSTECTLKESCYRNRASGTEPSEYRQTYFVNPPGKEDGSCEWYWDRK